MARIDFYILAQQGSQQRQNFACRLAEKAYRLDHTVHIHTGSRADAERVDDLLWTFRDGSFVPHDMIATGSANRPTPVTIGCGSAPVEARDLLINLDDAIPDFAATFPRVAELVSADEDCKRESRKRFAAYRDNGHEIETHKV
ncbi:MAG: DNA polymerase III subunit chi [Gammaproteobacteria bacterium]|nr:DNA polymerase III subunit chi [Gammaproteobacteria bacterium]